MFRNKKIDEYGNIVFAAVNDLFKVCEQNALSKTDLLLCFQNGFRSWDATPCIGIGEEGLDSLQGFNSAFACGLPHTTDDMDLEIPELNSPSALAIFCCGGSRNGPKSWADKDKKKYDAKWWAGEDAPLEIATPATKEQIG